MLEEVKNASNTAFMHPIYKFQPFLEQFIHQ